jgi:hypothetical protein
MVLMLHCSGVVIVKGKYLISAHCLIPLFASNMSFRLLTAQGANGWKVTKHWKSTCWSD